MRHFQGFCNISSWGSSSFPVLRGLKSSECQQGPLPPSQQGSTLICLCSNVQLGTPPPPLFCTSFISTPRRTHKPRLSSSYLLIRKGNFKTNMRWLNFSWYYCSQVRETDFLNARFSNLVICNILIWGHPILNVSWCPQNSQSTSKTDLK